ncbi:ferritin-like domain-containing protein [Sporolactobacillus shoreicorticis]|uniref:Rubrerythrin diiron-binding domain-containing protein n=1 Tax=Sporolactobacillus shoreicorticis TaxID=1923877 RepID=A0ABW5S7Z8_9BACL|nr:ferritin-like domain-containing protein [Sporolactobacillus shoreicorticis]MCO7125783.1 ferritin-like domain-containing protein [Sporolactobacillus shoreicorticis]
MPLGENTQTLNRVRSAVQRARFMNSCFRTLFDGAKTKRERQELRALQKNEARIEEGFCVIYESISGGKPLVGIDANTDNTQPRTYLEGLRHCIEQELRNAEFYRESGDSVSDSELRARFYSAALDEQRHAAWLHYFYLLYK